MSWVRWSSDSFRSDVYAYESDHGVEIHVANRRHDVDWDAMPPEVDMTLGVGAWLERYELVRSILDNSPLVQIGGPSDGQNYCVETEAEAYAILRRLQAEGYWVPEWVFDGE